MTDRQKQNLLQYLGYYKAEVDGIWGEMSRKATADFQRAFGLPATGNFDDASQKRILEAISSGEAPQIPEDNPIGTFWDEIEYFTREEFRCQCGGKYCNGFPVEPEEKMVRTVDEIRRRLGVPVSIVDAGGSGVRCEVHNAAVGGVYNSEHLYGRAADLHSSASPAQMKAVAEEVMGQSGGIGLYDWGSHVDTGKHSRWNG